MAGITRTATQRAMAGTSRQIQKVAPIDRRKVERPVQPKTPRNTVRK